MKTKNGEEYIGRTYMVWDAEESDDDRDSITVEMDNGAMKSFYPDEIESIEVIE